CTTNRSLRRLEIVGETGLKSEPSGRCFGANFEASIRADIVLARDGKWIEKCAAVGSPVGGACAASSCRADVHVMGIKRRHDVGGTRLADRQLRAAADLFHRS